jgi:hypothetical protein
MVRCVSAGERFDRTEFRREVEYLDHVAQLATYRCPHCRTEVAFFSGYFDEGAHHTKIDPQWRSQFDAARPLVAFEEAFEFYCRRCRAPVRVVYENKYNRSRFVDTDLLNVLEIAEWPEAPETPDFLVS